MADKITFPGFTAFRWPVPILQNPPDARNPNPMFRRPEVSSPYGTPRRVGEKDEHTHQGVDIMFRRLKDEPDGKPNGSKLFYMPNGVPALAAGPGVVYTVAESKKGTWILIDHGFPFTTGYQHLDSGVFVKKGDKVIAGQPIGIIGAGKEPGGLKHLHFELHKWSKDGGHVALNPYPDAKKGQYPDADWPGQDMHTWGMIGDKTPVITLPREYDSGLLGLILGVIVVGGVVYVIARKDGK